ncbi:ras and EF-hand domain-containing protein, partial [Plakobranchus ocellatus]
MADGNISSRDLPEGRAGGEEEAALRRYLCLGPGENAISRQRFTAPGQAASLGLTAQELDAIFSALDTDGDDVITLDQLLEQWPGNGELQGVTEDSAEQCDETHERSLTNGLEDSHSDIIPHTPGNDYINVSADGEDIGPKLRTAPEDWDGGSGEYYKSRRRSSLLLQIFDRRASPQPPHTSTPSLIAPSREDFFSVSSDQTPTSSSLPSSSPSSPPPILSSLSPILLGDIFPKTAKCVRGEEETEAAYNTPSKCQQTNLHCDISSPEPGSPTSPTSPTTPTPKTAQCDHSCVHPSKLTLSDLMASPQDSRSSGGSSISYSSSGGCKDTHKHVMRKIRPGSSVSKIPVVADSTLRVLIPKHPNQSKSMGSNRSTDSLNSVVNSTENLHPDSAKTSPSYDRHLKSPADSGRHSRWSAHQLSPIDGTTPTIRRLRPKSPRPEKAGGRKVIPLMGPSRLEPLDMELTTLSKASQEQVCELYQNLHTADNPELLTQFENIVLNVIHDVRQYQLENERLEKTYQREKDEHLKHLRRLEEEMEQQVQSVEERVRRQEKEKLESEKVELRNVLDSEIVMLQQNLTKLQA